MTAKVEFASITDTEKFIPIIFTSNHSSQGIIIAVHLEADFNHTLTVEFQKLIT
jgi:hypothetical protein